MEKASQVNQLFMAGGFRLHKWVANQNSILKNIDASRCIKIEKKFDDGEVLKALGVKWNSSTDAFVFTFDKSVFSVPKITKRSVLAMIARLFDPLGYLAPVIVIAKIFLQSLWTTKLAWDEALTSNLAAQWTNFAAALSAADTISVPRWLGTFQGATVELHGFSDASRSALAAVVYVRIVEEDFYAMVSLLASKTRVAPLKTVTIARLELSAAVLLAQLVTKVRASLNFAETIPPFLWTDSAVALTWIRGDPLRWKEFVGNRVTLIRELVLTAKWRHVPGEDHPADVASRGMPPQQLRSHETWWRGPAWLTSPSTSWPRGSPLLPDDTNLEEKPAAVHLSSPVVIWDLVTKFSTVERLTRVTARVLDAVSRFRGMKSEVDASGVLTPELLGKALRFWIVGTQRAYFSNDIKALQGEGSVGRSSPLRLLTPFVDENGVLRVGGRLQKASLEFDKKHPAILPREAKLSELLIRQAHHKTLHGGAQSTLALLRQQVWILGGPIPVRSQLSKCVICTRHRGATWTQKMGQLPTVRTTPSRPFLNSGVDYAGPFLVKAWRGRGFTTAKAFLVIFVCLATSAVHLEMATDYSTEGFLASYRRFTSRRGLCASLRSDCGTNFVGADKELRRLFDAASREFSNLCSLLANEKTTWHFNPPSAPHFGGKWEAGRRLNLSNTISRE